MYEDDEAPALSALFDNEEEAERAMTAYEEGEREAIVTMQLDGDEDDAASVTRDVCPTEIHAEIETDLDEGLVVRSIDFDEKVRSSVKR